MNLNLKGKVAVVTGGSKGIGAGIAVGLAAEGVSIAVNYNNNHDDADKVVQEIISIGGRAIAVKGDVSKRKDVEELFAVTKKTFGEINILVNNAGIFQFDPIEAFEVERFHQYFNINVLGVFLTTQEVLKYMPASGGSIINIGATLSQSPSVNGSLYSATKAAVDTITMALAKELGPRNIRVNTVAPGPTITEGSTTMKVDKKGAAEHIIGLTPLGRLGAPEDIARVVVFLASDAAGWVTGERINASGGLR